jgi:phosphohistidine phosphatase
MKHLILIRHAESAEKVTGQSDKDRDLTTGGIHQGAAAGAFINKLSLQIDIILSSTASRAQQTAQLIAEQISSAKGKSSDILAIDDELYQASLGTLFELIRNSDQYQNIVIVGHNPTLSYFAEFISGANIPELAPGNVLVFKISIGNWKDLTKGSATLVDRFNAS